MKPKFRKWGKNIFLAFTILIVVLYLLVCLVPFINAGTFWFISLIGLVFPFLFFIMVFLLLFWAIKRSKWFFLILVALLLGWQQVSAAFGIHFFKNEFRVEKDDNTLRILSWNVFRWDEQNKKAKGGVSYRNLMLDFIGGQNADVLCLQEFFEPYKYDYFQSNINVLAEMGYKYHFFYPTASVWNGELKFGMAIFSRYPLADSGQVSFGQTPHSEGICYTDVKMNNNNIVRIFSTHMESSRMGKSGSSAFDNGETGSIDATKQGIRTLRQAYVYRSIQADIVRDEINKSPYPVVMCGNLGDIPNSHAYFTVRGNLQDAFIKKGAGFGGTFSFISPTLRIDYIFADKHFKVQQFDRPKIPYSDHYPIIADITLTN